jgi:hypothetical protein
MSEKGSGERVVSRECGYEWACMSQLLRFVSGYIVSVGSVHPSHPVVEISINRSQNIIHLGNQIARQKRERRRLSDGWLVHRTSHNKEARVPYCSRGHEPSK